MEKFDNDRITAKLKSELFWRVFPKCGTLRSGVQRVKEEEDRQKDIDKLSTNVSGNESI